MEHDLGRLLPELLYVQGMQDIRVGTAFPRFKLLGLSSWVQVPGFKFLGSGFWG
jgi:hypothetical protein